MGATPLSAHSIKSKRRHPNPSTFNRERYSFGHMTFELIDHPKDGVSFCLLAGPPDNLFDDKPICSGFMKKSFAKDLSEIMQRVLQLKEERKLPDRCSRHLCDNQVIEGEEVCVVCFYDEEGERL